MDRQTLGNLFVSYCHADESDMLVFLKHLKGMLLDKVQVWSDNNIPKGTTWESFLKDNLNLASSALVLVTPDYLISSWCRFELQQLAVAHGAQRLRNLFWVQLKACGWRHTELTHFQASGGSSELAIDDAPNEIRRQKAILDACEQIASAMESGTDKDKHLAFVRGLLLEAQEGHEGHNIIVTDYITDNEFSVVCKGFSGSINATIKVLAWRPLKKLADDLLKIGRKRKTLDHQTFVRIHNIFKAGHDRDERIVFVSDYVDGDTLSSLLLARKEPFPIDRAVSFLRRLAEGLVELHKQQHDDELQSWQNTLGLLAPQDIYYDKLAERLRIPPIGVSSFLWNVLDSATYAEWVNEKSLVYCAPEQRNVPGGRLTPKTDQYMLGRLGAELLEGLHLEQLLKGEPVEKFWSNPEEFLGGQWRITHPQLWEILKVMLQTEPSERFKDMELVSQRLDALEEEGRALAKYVYCAPSDLKKDGMPHLEENMEFFKQFYETFFAMSPESKIKFDKLKSLDKQYEKLMRAMIAVLNFKPGNEPTSLTQFVSTHRKIKISAEELDKFCASFLRTIDKHYDSREVRVAWERLLKPVIEYMKQKCVGATTDKKGKSKSIGSNKRAS